MNASSETSRAIRIWDRLAAGYDLMMAPLERLIFRRWRRRMAEELTVPQFFLEVGAGTGANLDHYPAGGTGIVTDLSPGMLARAARRRRPAGIRLVVADAQQLPFREAVFDTVVSTLVFCGVPDQLQGLRESRRVLRAGGRLLAVEHVRPGGILGYVFDLLNPLTVLLIGDHINRPTAARVSEASFTVERVRSGAAGVVQMIVARRS
jgi:phosphatidylethanolamine/phosphatidyl-N-methylethanolamine N-methyltransferase